jgi:hypothetical protein
MAVSISGDGKFHAAADIQRRAQQREVEMKWNAGLYRVPELTYRVCFCQPIRRDQSVPDDERVGLVGNRRV